MTDEEDAALDAVLIPIPLIRERLGISERTMARRLTGIERHRFNGGYAVKYGDIAHLLPGGTL